MAAKRPLTAYRSLATAIDHPAASKTAAPLKARSSNRQLGAVRSNWLRHEVQEIFDAPLMETVFKAVSCYHAADHDLMTRKADMGTIVSSDFLYHRPKFTASTKTLQESNYAL